MTPLVVLSMPRSGTSLAAQILGLLGCALPDDQLPPSEQFNPDGFFESEALLRLRVGLEDALGINFSFPRCVREADWSRIHEPVFDAFRARAREKFAGMAERCAQEGTPFWVFKDPRASALLPFWTDFFEREGIQPRYVAVIRHPAAVARSVRNMTGLAPRMSELIWLESIGGIFSFLRDKPFVLLTYEHWFKDDRQVEALCQSLALDGLPFRPDRLTAATRAIKPSLNHGKVDCTDMAPDSLALRLYEEAARLHVRNAGLSGAMRELTGQVGESLSIMKELSAFLQPEAYAQMTDFDQRARAWHARVDELEATIRELEAQIAEMSGQAGGQAGAIE